MDLKLTPEEQKELADVTVREIERVLNLHGKTVVSFDQKETDMLIAIFQAGGAAALRFLQEKVRSVKSKDI